MMTFSAAGQDEELEVDGAQEGADPPLGWGPEDGTPGVTLEIREVRREPQDSYTEVTAQVHVDGAPMGKTYNLWLQDLGMFDDGLPPAPLNSVTRP